MKMDVIKDRRQKMIKLHGEILDGLKSTTEKAARLGQLLTETKAELPHGEFGNWIRSNLPFSQDTAERYMKVATWWSSEMAKSAQLRNLDMGLVDVYKLLPHKKKAEKDTSTAMPQKKESQVEETEGQEPKAQQEFVSGFTEAGDEALIAGDIASEDSETEVNPVAPTVEKPTLVETLGDTTSEDSEKVIEIKAVHCPSCDRLVRLEDADVECPPFRECSSEYCGVTFVSDERNCPQCNRPFTAKLSKYGCEECQEEMEETIAFECNNQNCSQDGLHLTIEEAKECGKPKTELESSEPLKCEFCGGGSSETWFCWGKFDLENDTISGIVDVCKKCAGPIFDFLDKMRMQGKEGDEKAKALAIDE